MTLVRALTLQSPIPICDKVGGIKQYHGYPQDVGSLWYFCLTTEEPRMPGEEEEHRHSHRSFPTTLPRKKKAGTTVINGKGQNIVGTFVTSRPSEAGTSSPKPAVIVAIVLFETAINGKLL